MRRYLRKRPKHTELSKLLQGRIPMVALVQTLAVAEHLSFRHAAHSLGVSQSSVSARVRMLEEELGIQLFERSTRGVRLTDAGQHFVDTVATGVNLVEHAVKTAGTSASGQCGRLRIGAHGLIAGSFLDNLIAGYRKEYPSIDVELVEVTARNAIKQLRSNRIDVAFVVGECDLPDCNSRPIWAEALVVAISMNHALAERSGVVWEDISGEHYLVSNTGIGPQIHEHIMLRFAGRLSPPAVQRLEVERDTLLSMVAQGFGITLLGAANRLFPTPGVVTLPIINEPEPIIFSAVWSPHNRSAILRNLFSLAKEMAR